MRASAEIPRELSDALASQYTITRELGQDGMARVFLAQDIKHRRDVALKVLRDEQSAVLGAERFEREISAPAFRASARAHAAWARRLIRA